MMPQKTYTQEFLLRFSECDCHGRMKLRTFFDYGQEAAGAHASALGVGAEVLRPQHRAWFLSRIRARFTRYPAIGARVVVTTYPVGFDRLFARREYRLEEPGQGVFATGTGDWLLMDTQAMRILPASREVGAVMPDNSDLPVTFPELGKLPPGGEDSSKELHFPIRGTQIDMNRHLNNIEYASILQDSLGAGVYPAEFQLNYQKGVPLGSDLVVTGGRQPSGEFRFAGRVEGAVAFETAGTILNIEEGDKVYGI